MYVKLRFLSFVSRQLGFAFFGARLWLRTFLFLGGFMETINDRLKKARTLSGITQREMAKMLGKALSTYSRMEKSGSITCEDAIKISRILDIELLDLIYGPLHNFTSSDIQMFLEEDLVEWYRNSLKENKGGGQR